MCVNLSSVVTDRCWPGTTNRMLFTVVPFQHLSVQHPLVSNISTSSCLFPAWCVCVPKRSQSQTNRGRVVASSPVYTHLTHYAFACQSKRVSLCEETTLNFGFQKSIFNNNALRKPHKIQSCEWNVTLYSTTNTFQCQKKKEIQIMV